LVINGPKASSDLNPTEDQWDTRIFPLFQQNLLLLQLELWNLKEQIKERKTTNIQGVCEVKAFLLTCDSMRCSKEF
jgi:hypothetical protein